MSTDLVNAPGEQFVPPAFFDDEDQRPVTLPAVQFARAALAPSRASASRALEAAKDRRPRDLTATLMGDPSPERSALGRPLEPHEYASKGGEGRYSDRLYC